MGLDAIDRIRKERGLSIEELAVKSGVPIGTLSKINAGITKDPKLETVKAIVKALGCTLDDLDEDIKEQLSREEHNIIKKYRALDQRGKDTVIETLNREYSYVAADAAKQITGTA